MRAVYLVRIAAILLTAGLALGQVTVDPALLGVQALIDQGKLAEAESAAHEYLETHATSADGHYLLGYILFKENSPKASLAEYAEGGRYRAPGALDLEAMGDDYFLMKDYGNADKWLTQSVELNPKDAVAQYFLGRAKYNEKYFEEAIRCFEACLKLDPKNAKAEENLGLVYERSGRIEDALAAYRAAIAANTASGSKDFEAYVDLGIFLADNQRTTEAISYLRQAVEMAPDNLRANRELGRAYLATNQLEKAQMELGKAATLDPQDAPVRFLLSQVYQKRGLTDKARIEISRYSALTRAHSSPDTPLAEARLLVDRGKWKDAEGTIRQYLEIHKNSADAHYLLGYVLFKEEDAKPSLAEYTEAAKYRKPTAGDLEVVAGDYVLLRDYPDADKWFTVSVEWNPGNLQTLYYLGRTKYNENRFEEAVSVFAQCLKLDPKNVKAEDNLGLSYAGMGRTEDAVAAYRTAIVWEARAAVKDSGPYVDLGTALVESDRSSEAVSILLEALRISPRELRAHRELGKAYLHLNQLEKAQFEFEKAVELDPQNAPIHYMLAQVYRRRGFSDKARAEDGRYMALTGAHSAPEAQ